MAVSSIDLDKVRNSFDTWIGSVYPNGTWEGNGIHIDEIDSLGEVERREWIDISLELLSVFSPQLNQQGSLIPFLRIELNYSPYKRVFSELSLDALKENISEYTPPDFHFTSLEYYNHFYSKELAPLNPHESILKRISSVRNAEFFYSTYFDKDEEMYSGDIYIFIKE